MPAPREQLVAACILGAERRLPLFSLASEPVAAAPSQPALRRFAPLAFHLQLYAVALYGDVDGGGGRLGRTGNDDEPCKGCAGRPSFLAATELRGCFCRLKLLMLLLMEPG